jgi:hypothetical protein
MPASGDAERTRGGVVFRIAAAVLFLAVSGAAWKGCSLIEADRAACEADGRRTHVRTYEGFACIEGRKTGS